MADEKISDLPGFSGSVAVDDLFAIVDTSTGVTKKVPLSSLVLPYLKFVDSNNNVWKLSIDITGMPVTEDLGPL